MRGPAVVAIGVITFFLTGCERAMQDMYVQPRHGPMEPDPFHADGSSARMPPPGTFVARTGPFADASSGRAAATPEPDVAPPVEPIIDDPPGDLTIPIDLPVPVTTGLLARGRERFEIYCSPCHGYDGAGAGMIVRRGFPAPPSYHTARLRQAPSQHYYNVITHGYGDMSSYAARVMPADRWAIIAYIRTLQLSQHTRLSELTQEERAKLEGAPDPSRTRAEGMPRATDGAHPGQAEGDPRSQPLPLGCRATPNGERGIAPEPPQRVSETP